MMVTLTALVALAFVACTDGSDRADRVSTDSSSCSLMGLNGAFLTGDLFNLFVFFEVLLIASYALLLQNNGQGWRRNRLKAALYYVIVNLGGSALFLIGVATLYGVTGTLNMADLAVKIGALGSADAGLVHAAGLLLLVVFCVKGALLPLNFWLPATYSAAALPVAALFAVLTKVGVYAIARVFTLLFPAGSGPAADAVHGPLLAVALATVIAAAFGTVAADSLRRACSYLIIGSAATLLATLALGTPAALGAAFFYMLHSTLAAAALFLVAQVVADRRGTLGDSLRSGPAMARETGTASLFLGAAVAMIGLPPLAGFVAKALLVSAAAETPWMLPFTAVILGATLLNMLALATAGSRLFWKSAGRNTPHPAALPRNAFPQAAALGAAALLGVILLMLAAAGPVYRYALAAGKDLVYPQAYIDTVLGTRPVDPQHVQLDFGREDGSGGTAP